MPGNKTEIEKEKDSVCVCVCVCVRQGGGGGVPSVGASVYAASRLRSFMQAHSARTLADAAKGEGVRHKDKMQKRKLDQCSGGETACR